MQSNDSLKKLQVEALETIETWPLKQYFFNMIQYALKKQIALPFIEFTLNGERLFRLSVEEEEEDESKSDDEEEETHVQLEFILKYFGSQTSFQKNKTEYYTLNAADAKKIKPCNVPNFKLVYEDDETVSRLCFGRTFESVTMTNLEKALDCVLYNFQFLQSLDQKHAFDEYPENSVERLFGITANDKTAVAYELYDKDVAPTKAFDDNNKDGNETMAEEWKRVEEKSRAIAKTIAKQSTVSSCELHADIWQRNEKLRMTAIGRQYENLVSVPSGKIGDAMHVKFRGADEDLQKRICIGELLVNLLPTLVINNCYK